jgi:hypothetical protein
VPYDTFRAGITATSRSKCINNVEARAASSPTDLSFVDVTQVTMGCSCETSLLKAAHHVEVEKVLGCLASIQGLVGVVGQHSNWLTPLFTVFGERCSS